MVAEGHVVVLGVTGGRSPATRGVKTRQGGQHMAKQNGGRPTLAELESGDTADGLTECADNAMLGVKAAHRARP